MKTGESMHMPSAEMDRVKFHASLYSILASAYNTPPTEKFLKTLTGMEIPENCSSDMKSILQTVKIKYEESDRGKYLNLIQKEWNKYFHTADHKASKCVPCIYSYTKQDHTATTSELIKIYKTANYNNFLNYNKRHDYIGSLLGYLAHIAHKAYMSIHLGRTISYISYTVERADFADKYIKNWFAEYYLCTKEYIDSDFYRCVLTMTYLTVYT